MAALSDRLVSSAEENTGHRRLSLREEDKGAVQFP